MDEIIKNYKSTSFDNELIYCPSNGVMYQKDLSQSIEYDKAYYEKYLSYEDTEIAIKLNNFRVAISEKYSKKDILDIGVGSGEFIKKSRKKVFGFDINQESVFWLKSNNIFINPYLGIPTNIDCVTFFDSLEHIKQPDILLEKINENTYVIISIPIFENLLNVKDSKHYRPNEHYYYFTMYGIIEYMYKGGFAFVLCSDSESKAGRDNILTFVFYKTEITKIKISNLSCINFTSEVCSSIQINYITGKVFINNFKIYYKYLFVLGDTSDLSKTAKYGLVAHLYGWCYILSQEEKGEKYELNWFQKDELADKIAIDWGYKEEIEALRAIRPLKTSGFEPTEIPIYLSEYSIPNKEFYDNVTLFFNKQTQKVQNKILNDFFFFYKDRFSVALKTSVIPHGKKLVIFTQPNNFEKELQKMINREL